VTRRQKLVIANATDGIAAACAQGQSAGHGSQRLISGVLAVNFAETFELLQVDKQHCQQPVVALGERNGNHQAIGKQLLVRQAGHLIVHGETQCLPFCGRGILHVIVFIGHGGVDICVCPVNPGCGAWASRRLHAA
jgi:hypothetical protein